MAQLNRSFLTILLVLAAMLVLTPARAQLGGESVTLTETSVRRVQPLHREFPERLYWISFQDCLKDDQFTFPLMVVSNGTKNIEVWVGPDSTDCKSDTARSNDADSTTDCWKVATVATDGGLTNAKVAARAIVAGRVDDPASIDESVCSSDAYPDGLKVKVWFLLMNGVAVQAHATFPGVESGSTMGFDLVGPAAPGNVEGGPAENAVSMTWDMASDTEGYRFYCEEVGAAPASPAPTGLRPLAVAGAAGMAGATASLGGVAGASAGSGGMAGATGLPGAAGISAATGGAAGSAPTSPSDCDAAQTLASGQMPDPAMLCGESGQTGGEGLADNLGGSSLKNDTLYAVAVASVDELGNSGPLSNVVCAIPQPVETFFERYAAQGGQGGGGFCAVGMGKAHGFWLCLAGAALLLGIRRRRAS